MRCLPDKTYPSYDTDTLIAFCPQIVDETEIILDPESQTYTHTSRWKYSQRRFY